MFWKKDRKEDKRAWKEPTKKVFNIAKKIFLTIIKVLVKIIVAIFNFLKPSERTLTTVGSYMTMTITALLGVVVFLGFVGLMEFLMPKKFEAEEKLEEEYYNRLRYAA